MDDGGIADVKCSGGVGGIVDAGGVGVDGSIGDAYSTDGVGVDGIGSQETLLKRASSGAVLGNLTAIREQSWRERQS